MDRTDLGPILVRVYEASREQLEMTVELMCSLTAAIEVLQANDPGFAAAYREKVAALQCGEMGRTKARKVAAFDQMIERLKGGRQ